MSRIRVSDCVMNVLHKGGVSQMFFLSGRGILFLTDALARHEGLVPVTSYHEQGAAYAAMAYAQASGKLGTCLVSTGCGATNAITPVLCAWQDNVPLLVISGNHMLDETTAYTGIPLRTYGSQEADIVSLVKPITKYVTMITDPTQIRFEVEKAMYLAMEGRKGPVWLDIPLDIQNARIQPEDLPSYSLPEIHAVDFRTDAKRVLEELSEARRPLLLAGGGIRSGKEALEQFLEQTGLPLVFTPAACDVYGTGNDLSLGAVGSIGGSRPGNFALQNADYVLAVGTKLCSQVTGTDYEKFLRAGRMVVVDIDPIEHTKKEAPTDRVIHADAKAMLETLLSGNLPQIPEKWKETCRHWKEKFSVKNEEFVQRHRENGEIDLYSFADCLSKDLPVDATVITDAGFEELIIPSTIQYRRDQRCLFPAAQGAMGYGIPAILGAYFAGKKHIVAVVGDGSIMMNVQELQTIAYHHIPVKIFVINNGMYAVIRRRQRDLFRNRTIGNDPSDGLGVPDFEALAKAFGLSYYRWDTSEDMNREMRGSMTSEEGFLCEVRCTEQQEYLHKSYGRNEKGRLEYRPLEDLSPFLAREVLREEMLIPLWKGGA